MTSGVRIEGKIIVGRVGDWGNGSLLDFEFDERLDDLSFGPLSVEWGEKEGKENKQTTTKKIYEKQRCAHSENINFINDFIYLFNYKDIYA